MLKDYSRIINFETKDCWQSHFEAFNIKQMSSLIVSFDSRSQVFYFSQNLKANYPNI